MLHIVSDKFHVVWTSKGCDDILISSHTDYEQAQFAVTNICCDEYCYRLFPNSMGLRPNGHVRISQSHAFDK